MQALEGGATATFADGQRFSTQIGNSRLTIPKTGEQQRTSAGSAKMFDPDGHVIWSARA
jgi:hypothetical protein